MQNEDKISNEHPHYAGCQAEREIYLDLICGTRKLREKHKTYLPKFEAEREGPYKMRWRTATLFNMTKKTRDVMTGLIFKEEITLGSDVDATIAKYWESIDNAGKHGDVFAREAMEEAFAGCSVILVDAPQVKAESLEQEQKLGLRPYWLLYQAGSVINGDYRINKISRKRELEFIVFKEVTKEKRGSKFTFEDVTRYRHFFLKDEIVKEGNNEYVKTSVHWELVREETNERGEQVFIPEGGGLLERLTQIPVAIVGKLWHHPRLMDIVYKNIELFQVYSDFKADLHKVMRPVGVARNLAIEPNSTLVIGSDVLIEVDTDGDFKFEEPKGSSLVLVRDVLHDQRDDMALLGLSLLADKTAKVDVTATEALLNNIGETAEIRVMARELKDAIELALGHTAEYLGLPREKGGSIELGTSWANEGQMMDASEGMMPDKKEQKMALRS